MDHIRQSVRLTDERRHHLDRFYDLIEDLQRNLGGKRRLAECDGRMGWPTRGVYFFFEPGEFNGSGRDRIVRVGTHALKMGSGTTLWNRLSTHRGTQSGGGNHRGSIFRLLVGRALIAKDAMTQPETWGFGNDPGTAARKFGLTRTALLEFEAALEQRVSEYIGQMPILWLSIPDAAGPESTRGYIERNAIALLSQYRTVSSDNPSGQWLGTFSDRDKVRKSGLWNSNHVDENYDPHFLDEMVVLIEHMHLRA
ncbi:MAG: hypothetical protein H6978_14340 [Gammaproteobacteria bacterium]|nr:hypothetical protein [Gammaproteobacteria bacterium]